MFLDFYRYMCRRELELCDTAAREDLAAVIEFDKDLLFEINARVFDATRKDSPTGKDDPNWKPIVGAGDFE